MHARALVLGLLGFAGCVEAVVMDDEDAAPPPPELPDAGAPDAWIPPFEAVSGLFPLRLPGLPVEPYVGQYGEDFDDARTHLANQLRGHYAFLVQAAEGEIDKLESAPGFEVRRTVVGGSDHEIVVVVRTLAGALGSTYEIRAWRGPIGRPVAQYLGEAPLDTGRAVADETGALVSIEHSLELGLWSTALEGRVLVVGEETHDGTRELRYTFFQRGQGVYLLSEHYRVIDPPDGSVLFLAYQKVRSIFGRWLPGGAGRIDLRRVRADGAEENATECTGVAGEQTFMASVVDQGEPSIKLGADKLCVYRFASGIDDAAVYFPQMPSSW